MCRCLCFFVLFVLFKPQLNWINSVVILFIIITVVFLKLKKKQIWDRPLVNHGQRKIKNCQFSFIQSTDTDIVFFHYCLVEQPNKKKLKRLKVKCLVNFSCKSFIHYFGLNEEKKIKYVYSWIVFRKNKIENFTFYWNRNYCIKITFWSCCCCCMTMDWIWIIWNRVFWIFIDDDYNIL